MWISGSWIFPESGSTLRFRFNEIDESVFESGLGFDGSSIRGWQVINESDMLVKPDPATAFIDPMLEHKTLAIICNICDPITGEDYTRDPRNIAEKLRSI